MRAAIRNLILFGGGTSINWILRDDFTTPVSAPLAASRAAEPGPGTMTKNTDTSNWGSIDGSSNFVWSGGSGGFTGDPNYRWDAVTRASGRVCYFRMITGASTLQMAVGLIQATTVSNNWVNCAHALQFNTSTFKMLFNASAGVQSSNVANITTTTTYDIMFWMHTAGALWLIKGGVFTNWTPLFHELITSTATVYPVNINNAAVHKQKTMRVFDVPATYAVDYPLATVNVTNPVSGSNSTATADGLHEMLLTLPGSPAANDTMEMRYRIQDASNYWSAYVKRNAGNTAWDFYLDKVTAGTPATQTGFPVTGVGAVDAIQVRTTGDTHNCYTKVTTTWTKRANEISSSSFNTATGINATYAVGSVSKLSSLPGNDAFGAVLNSFLAA